MDLNIRHKPSNGFRSHMSSNTSLVLDTTNLMVRLNQLLKLPKNIRRRADMAKSDIFLAILNHCNTHNESGYSPAQCLMSRRTKTLMPTISNLLKPEVSIGLHSSLVAGQQRQVHYYTIVMILTSTK